MNKTTKKNINKLVDDVLRIAEELTEIKEQLQDQFDNMSEKRQEGEAGEKLSAEIDKLDDLITNLEYADDARPEE